MRLLTVPVVALVFAVGLVVGCPLTAPPTTAARAASKPCTPGPRLIRGEPVVVFCGSAIATVVANGKTSVFRGGSCYREPDHFAVEIGIFEENPRQFKYFGIGLSPAVKHDGVYTRNVQGEWHMSGSRLVIYNARLTVAGHLTRGSFTGRFADGYKFVDKGRVTGTFRC